VGVVPHRDIDQTKWNHEGARLKESVVNKFLIEALQVHREYSAEELREQGAVFAKRLGKKRK